MDVLSCETRWIDNRCYRLTPGSKSYISLQNHKPLKPIQSTFIEDEPDYDPDLPIIHAGNTFYVTIHCPGSLVGYIVGPKGKMLRALQQTGAKVSIAEKKMKEKSTEITVSAPNKTIVSITYNKIQSIITTNRLREDFTHFVSLPVNSSEICSSFERFKEEVLSKYIGVRGINESIFQTPSKLHVTIVPLVLFDERDIEQAEAILNECINSAMKDFGKKEFVVNVTGIEYMNDDPAEVDVLYAKLHEEEGDSSLQLTAENIMKKFIDANLAKDQYEKVKLHMTLMNTTFRGLNVDGERFTFDARPILKDYGNYKFGRITISEIHISIRYTKSSDGYYSASCKKRLK